MPNSRARFDSRNSIRITAPGSRSTSPRIEPRCVRRDPARRRRRPRPRGAAQDAHPRRPLVRRADGRPAQPTRASTCKTVFHERYDEVVLLRNIEFHSLCEHHLLPFTGRAHVAYLPDGKVVGLSKLARLVEGYARRPQVQERLTTQIADALMEELNPIGSACVIEAMHTCMTIRGAKKPGSTMVTSALRGIFKENPSSRAEILTLMYSSDSKL